MCTLLKNAATTSHRIALTSTEADALDYVNNLVNGNFLHIPKSASTADKVDTCLSTVCALMKEFSLDWSNDLMDQKPLTDQRDYLAYFGAYLEVPLRTLSDMLTRCWRVSRKRRSIVMQRLLDEYVSEMCAKRCPNVKDGDMFSAMFVLLASYLTTAMSCHKLWQSRRPVSRYLPWSVRISDRGAIIVRYTYNKHVAGPKGVRLKRTYMDYMLDCRVPKVQVAKLKAMYEMAKIPK